MQSLTTVSENRPAECVRKSGYNSTTFACDNSTVISEDQLYAVVGEDGFRRLVAAFYRRVPGDDILGPMYPSQDLGGAEQRLADFLIYRFGGPAKYTDERGHPRLRMRHAPFAINASARDRWLQLMHASMLEADLPPGAREVLDPFFDHVANFLRNRPDSE